MPACLERLVPRRARSPSLQQEARGIMYSVCVQQVHRHTFAERLARAERFARSWGEPVSQPVPAVVGKQSTVLNSMTEATPGPGPQRSCHAEPHRTRGSRTQDSRSRQAGRTGSCSLQDGSSYVSSPPPPQLLRLLLILAPWLFYQWSVRSTAPCSWHP